MKRDTNKTGYTLAAMENAAGQVWASDSDKKTHRVFRVAKQGEWIPSENGSQRIPTVRAYNRMFFEYPKQAMRKATDVEVEAFLEASALSKLKGESADVIKSAHKAASLIIANLINGTYVRKEDR